MFGTMITHITAAATLGCFTVQEGCPPVGMASGKRQAVFPYNHRKAPDSYDNQDIHIFCSAIGTACLSKQSVQPARGLRPAHGIAVEQRAYST